MQFLLLLIRCKKTLDDKKFGILIFLDISKAFDSACFDIILAKLRPYADDFVLYFDHEDLNVCVQN
ncbi:hypothetical protein DERF_014954 [Dermatophagoides farinae]|uniref:Reverse transcriptase domain-containing protein n=1 Tax=Dermatophagoides farinae TaxID=6954 RepID=A0A922HNC3_DERFA|nr:hypothetical protein DERF_014954 [Dermatophagoides farinae]